MYRHLLGSSPKLGKSALYSPSDESHGYPGKASASRDDACPSRERRRDDDEIASDALKVTVVRTENAVEISFDFNLLFSFFKQKTKNI